MAITITKPLAEHQANYTVTVNKMASDKITAKYPIYKQLNVARTADAEAMNVWIDSIRALAQTAKTAIAGATTIVGIRTAQDAYVTALSAL
jgi:hypothetical protein